MTTCKAPSQPSINARVELTHARLEVTHPLWVGGRAEEDPELSEAKFENQVSDIMIEIHRVAKRTDFPRNGENQRDFAHLALMEAE